MLALLLLACDAPRTDRLPIAGPYDEPDTGNVWSADTGAADEAPADADSEPSDRSDPTDARCSGDPSEPLSAAGLAQALALADSSTLGSIEDVESRIAELSAIFSACGDSRGLFTAAYLPITQRAVAQVRAGAYDDTEWAEALVEDFAGRYLDALHAHLSGEDPGYEWGRYYALAADAGASRARVVGTGVAVHLIVDLPRTLVAIETPDAREEDYLRFGADLVAVSDGVIASVEEAHGVEAEALFTGFFVGDWLDAAFGDAFTTTFAFTAIRGKAWNNRWLLQNGWSWLAESEIAASFTTVDLLFAALDAQGTL